MNIRIAISFLLGICSFIDINQLNAQENQSIVDCDFNDSINVIRSSNQFVLDSLEMADFIPAKHKLTERCAIPSKASLDVIFKLQNDKVYGFFRSVENADLY